MSRLPSCSIYGCRWHMSITVGRVMSMYHTWFSDEWRRKADELFEWESLYITSSSLRLWSRLRPSRHQGIPNWLQQWGAVWLLTEINKYSDCDLRRSFMSRRESPRCNWDGGCMQATESRARPHWVFQGECRIALFKTFSSILVPTNFLLHLTLVAQQFSFLLFFVFRTTFDTGRALHDHRSWQLSSAPGIEGQLNAYSQVKLRCDMSSAPRTRVKWMHDWMRIPGWNCEQWCISSFKCSRQD